MKRALVVEDDITIRRLIGIYLERRGFTVEFAGDGKEAVNLTGKHQYTLIVMDVYLPEMNGIDAVMEIRASDERQQRKRVPIVSTSSDDEVQTKIMAAGADEFFVKPWLFEQLDEFLNSF